MGEQLFKRIVKYRTVAMVKSMLYWNIISAAEYDEIDKITAQEYDLTLSVIYR